MQPNRLAKFREVSELTRAQVAERLDVSDRTVYRWERGETNPNGATLAILATIYGGVSIGYLMGLDNTPRTERDKVAA